MVSSLPTLDRIIENDMVDDLFRREIVWKSIAANLFGCLAGACGAAYSVSSLLETGIDFGHSLLGSISLAAAGVSVHGLNKALRARSEYMKMLRQGLPADPRPYFIDGRISPCGTAIEQAYGFPLDAFSSLDCIRNDVLQTIGPGFGFLDHVFVRDVHKYDFETTEFIGTSEGSHDQKMNNYGGSFTIERLGERAFLNYFFRGSMCKDLDALLSFAGEELAFVFRPVHYYFNSGRSPFSVERIFHPHP